METLLYYSTDVLRTAIIIVLVVAVTCGIIWTAKRLFKGGDEDD